MPPRRILSLWFPRLAAERVLRAEPQLADQPLAVVADARGALVLASLTRGGRGGGAPARHGARRRPRDLPRARHPARGRRRATPAFLRRAPALGRALLAPGSPRRARRRWCSTSPAARISSAARRRSPRGSRPRRRTSASRLRLGLADTLGAAWAVARYAGAGRRPAHAGDAIDQEARATRSRARKRRWERGGAPPPPPAGAACRIVPPGETLAAHRAAAGGGAAARAGRGRRALQALGLAPDRRRWRRCRGRSSPAGSGRRWPRGSTRRSGGRPSRCRRRGRRRSSRCA